jgi:hypothetical protein
MLNNTGATPGLNVSIPIGITIGNQTIWVTEGYVIVGEAATNYSLSVN